MKLLVLNPLSWPLSILVCFTLLQPTIADHNVGSSFIRHKRYITTPAASARFEQAHPALIPRADPVTDEVWNKAVRKGGDHIAAMLSDDSIQSEYFDYPGDLKKWGYGSLEYDDYYDFKWSIPIKKALENIGVSAKKKDEGGPNRAWNWEHESEVTIDGKKYLPTGATFLNIFNPEDGVIIAWGNYGPAYRAKKKDPPIELLPKLQKWSDVAFLQWYATSGKGDSTKNINYILQTPIENEESVSLIERALANTKKELKTWPGVEFDAESDEGKAILGSPNGSGIGFFLTQHKKWLGNKMVVKLTVFQDDGVAPRPPSVIFHIEESC